MKYLEEYLSITAKSLLNSTMVVSAPGKISRSTIPDDYYIHTRLGFKIFLVIIYTIVFLSCLAGNSLVVAVVAFQRRMRSATNLFLTNLAIADLMVALFCVYQNLLLWVLDHEWALGTFPCKAYHFAHAYSYTASVLIMVLVAIERYVAIIHPLAARTVLRTSNLRVVTIFVWLLSAAICAPRIWMYDMVQISSGSGTGPSLICTMQLKHYDPKIYNILNFAVLFLIPVILMILIYVRLALRLYSADITNLTALTRINKKTKNVANKKRVMGTTSESNRTQNSEYDEYDSTSIGCFGRKISAFKNTLASTVCSGQGTSNNAAAVESHMLTVVAARRKAIRLLVAVVVAFIVCHLPNHVRKLLQDWYPGYRGGTNASILFAIFTNLLMYANSSCNPILYALMSRKFRMSMKEVAKCKKTGCCRKDMNAMRLVSNGHVRVDAHNTRITPLILVRSPDEFKRVVIVTENKPTKTRARHSL